MNLSRTHLEDLAHELVELSERNSVKADRLIDLWRRARRDRKGRRQPDGSLPGPGGDEADPSDPADAA